MASPDFASLGLDIHLVILRHLDPSDVLNIRRSCRALHQATQERTIWFALLDKLCRQNAVVCPSFDHPNMTLAQLERVVMSPKRWEELVTSGTLEPRRIRQLRPKQMFGIIRSFLVPGGRFHLTLDANGQLSLWDVTTLPDIDPSAEESNEDDGPYTEPLATLPEACKYLLPSYIPDDENSIRVLVQLRDIGKRAVYDISPRDPEPKFRLINYIEISGIMGGISMFGDRVFNLYNSMVCVWNFKEDTWVSWNTGRVSNDWIQVYVEGNVIAFINESEVLLWDIPPMGGKAQDLVSQLYSEPGSVRQPDAILPFPHPTPEYEITPHRCAGIHDWYAGSPGALWFDVLYVDETTAQHYTRFKVQLPDQISSATLANSKLLPLFDFPVVDGGWPSLYRVCGDKSVSWWSSPDGMQVSVSLIGKPHDGQAPFVVHDELLNPPEFVGYPQTSLCPVSGRLVYSVSTPKGLQFNIVDYLD